MLKPETVRLADWYRGIKELGKQLDPTNIKILSAMWRFGPRNLLEVSRQTGLPFTTVYHRVAKLEAKSRRIAFLAPRISKLGMVEVAVLAAASPGLEQKVTEALKIPNLWWSTNTCEGAFTHHSIQAVPIQFLKDFKKYLRQISEMKLITHLRIIPAGDFIPNFPDFRYYSPHVKQWKFEWSKWLTALRKAPSLTIKDPEGHPLLADRKDVLIVKELEKNARRSFADLAPMVGITLQGVKYHYDKRLVGNGIIEHFMFDVVPYPIEVAAYHEVMLEFASTRDMNRFYSIVNDLFWVLGVSKVLRRNALLVRTYILQSQLANMFAFFSEMARTGMLEAYSSVRLDFAGRQVQTISYELFDEGKGWTFDLRKCTSELSKLR